MSPVRYGFTTLGGLREYCVARLRIASFEGRTDALTQWMYCLKEVNHIIESTNNEGKSADDMALIAQLYVDMKTDINLSYTTPGVRLIQMRMLHFLELLYSLLKNNAWEVTPVDPSIYNKIVSGFLKASDNTTFATHQDTGEVDGNE